MKCVVKNGTTVKRVSDKDAREIVGADWDYISKSEANKLDPKFKLYKKKFERLQKSS